MRIDQAKIREPLIKKENRENVTRRVSTYTESYKGEYYNIDISKLIPFKNQSRKIFDKKSLEELAHTIKIHGIRQPLTVLPSDREEGKYEIISGERRWRAAQIVGITKIPCIILQDKSVAEEIALIENVQRKNLHPIELMYGLQSLLDRGICKNHQEIAEKIGISRTVVVETLGLKNLPSSTRKLLLDRNIKSRDLFRQLLKLPEREHIFVINKEFKEKEEQPPSVKKVTSVRKNTLLSIYLQSEELFFDEIKKWTLTAEQRLKIKKYLSDLADRI